MCDVLGGKPKTRRPKSALQTLDMPLMHPAEFQRIMFYVKYKRKFRCQTKLVSENYVRKYILRHTLTLRELLFKMCPLWKRT